MRLHTPFVFVISCLFLSACSNTSKSDREIIKAIEESLTSSNQRINSSTEMHLWKLEDKLSEFRLQHKAEVWFPKAKEIFEFSQDCYSHIGRLKKQTFLTKEESQALFKKIKQYKLDVLSIDSKLAEYFSDTYLPNSDTSNNSEEKSFVLSFKNANTESTKALLTKLQNDIKVFENKTVSFCNEQVGSTIDYFQTYSAIVAQSSKVVGPNEVLEIRAGVGAFSKAALPKIFINRKNIPLAEDGASHYKLKVTAKPGKYSIPVKINFIDENGVEQIIDSKIVYTVAKICDE